jgi:hypothetical protein
MEAHARPVGAEQDAVAVVEHALALHALPVHERAVGAAQVMQHVPVAGAADLGVARRDVEVLVGVEAQVAQRVATDGDDRLVEPLARAGARSAGDAQFEGHQSVNRRTR